MNAEHDKSWLELARRIRQGARHVICGERAERLLHRLSDKGISDSDENDIVEAVVLGRSLREVRGQTDTHADNSVKLTSQESVEEDVLLLNRNKGATDEEAESTLDRLRREALDDDDVDQDQ